MEEFFEVDFGGGLGTRGLGCRFAVGQVDEHGYFGILYLIHFIILVLLTLLQILIVLFYKPFRQHG